MGTVPSLKEIALVFVSPVVSTATNLVAVVVVSDGGGDGVCGDGVVVTGAPNKHISKRINIKTRYALNTLKEALDKH